MNSLAVRYLRRYLLPVAAAGATVLAAGCASAAAQPPAHGSAPLIRLTGTTANAAAAPGHQNPAGSLLANPFAVVLRHSFGGSPAVIMNMATGRVTGQVRSPANSSFQWVAGTAGDRTFVLADESESLVYRFYRLTVGRSGHPLRLTRLPFALRDVQIYGLAISVDARRLAIALHSEPYGAQWSRIDVTSLSTGATRTWTSAAGGALDVSWVGNRTLAFDWQDGVRAGRSGIRLLNTAGRGASLLASRLLIPGSFRTGQLSGPYGPQVTANGSVLFAVLATSRSAEAIAQFSARTGKLIRVLTKPTSSTNLRPLYCGVLRADRTGQRILLQCGTIQAAINRGRSVPVRLPLIQQSPVGWSNTFAW